MKAVVMVHTPSGETPCCEDHANMATNLFEAMGCCVTKTVLPSDDIECVNCLNAGNHER
jgi:hypothetical protein